MTDPRRIVDEASASEPARASIDALLEADPGYDVAAGAARFEAAVSGGGGPEGTPATKSPALKLLLLAAIATGVGVAAYAGMPRDPPAIAESVVANPPRVTPPPVIEASAKAPPPVAPPDEGPNAAQDVGPVSRGAQSQRDTPAKRRASSKPHNEAGDDRFLREMKALNTARKQVKGGQAKAALSTIAASRSLRKGSTFGEEWQALEILALAGAGKLEAARQKARPFLSKHPRGRFNASIKKATAGAEGSRP